LKFCYWLLVTSCQIPDTGMPNTGSQIPDTGYRIQDAGYQIHNTKIPNT
jgi:hypothetical protein